MAGTILVNKDSFAKLTVLFLVHEDRDVAVYVVVGDIIKLNLDMLLKGLSLTKDVICLGNLVAQHKFC